MIASRATLKPSSSSMSFFLATNLFSSSSYRLIISLKRVIRKKSNCREKMHFLGKSKTPLDSSFIVVQFLGAQKKHTLRFQINLQDKFYQFSPQIRSYLGLYFCFSNRRVAQIKRSSSSMSFFSRN